MYIIIVCILFPFSEQTQNIIASIAVNNNSSSSSKNAAACTCVTVRTWLAG